MSKRLYNKYGAAVGEHADFISNTMMAAAKTVMEYGKENDLDLRDVAGFADGFVSMEAAYYIIKNGIELKKAESK